MMPLPRLGDKYEDAASVPGLVLHGQDSVRADRPGVNFPLVSQGLHAARGASRIGFVSKAASTLGGGIGREVACHPAPTARPGNSRYVVESHVGVMAWDPLRAVE